MKIFFSQKLEKYQGLGGSTHALHGFASPTPPPLPLNLRGLWLNFINKKFLLLFIFSVALSFFCCGFFFSDKVFYRYR
jgi:hypothetical protein